MSYKQKNKGKNLRLYNYYNSIYHGSSSNREIPSQYADFTKSGILESQKPSKPSDEKGETPLAQKCLTPEPRDSWTKGTSKTPNT